MTDPLAAKSAVRSTDAHAAAGEVKDAYARLRDEVHKVIVGQDDVLDQLLVALFCGGHAIVVGVPGLAKTLLISTVARTLSLGFSRVQFTPDLMPSDMTGTEIIEEDKTTGARELRFVKGPIFSNVILADEINRTPPKTQAALLEAMQEKQVTVAGVQHKLPRPFFVLATQNPIEQEGTYPLPEAQVDRFMLKVVVSYPNKDEERKVVDLALGETAREVKPVLEPDQILHMQSLVKRVYLDDKVRDYVLELVTATRHPEAYQLKDLKNLIEFGASPRASIYLCHAARAGAFLAGRGFVTPQDVKDIAYDVLRHRVILSYEAEAEEISSEQVVKRILESVPVP